MYNVWWLKTFDGWKVVGFKVEWTETEKRTTSLCKTLGLQTEEAQPQSS